MPPRTPRPDRPALRVNLRERFAEQFFDAIVCGAGNTMHAAQTAMMQRVTVETEDYFEAKRHKEADRQARRHARREQRQQIQLTPQQAAA